MKYVALLRGINVGGNNKVEMAKLKTLFEKLECTNVTTYINSGNVIFETEKSTSKILEDFEKAFNKEFGFDTPTLFKTQKEIQNIANAIPMIWQNDVDQKTDILYLFPEIDNKSIIEKLPINMDFVKLHYVKGALILNVSRKDVVKSGLAKLVSNSFYKLMTIRNANTARILANK